MEYATNRLMQAMPPPCSRCIIFYTCSVATRIDADQARRCPHDWRLAVHPTKATTARWIATNKASSRFMCSSRAFQLRACSSCARPELRTCRGKPHRIFATLGLGERFGSLD